MKRRIEHLLKRATERWLNATRRSRDIQITITLPWFRRRREFTVEHRRHISDGLKRRARKPKVEAV